MITENLNLCQKVPKIKEIAHIYSVIKYAKSANNGLNILTHYA